jgi:hypothetical protein|tara:strand:+ start:431 stop:610 length:180 start_codon:yes stop_codon:yes gene_type:complete
VLVVDNGKANLQLSELLDRAVLVAVLMALGMTLLVAVQPPQVQQTQVVEVEVLEIEAIQ